MSKNISHRQKQQLLQLGRAVQYYRKTRNLTQEQLSELVNVSRTHISNFESGGKNGTISLVTFLSIAEALEIDPALLFHLEPFPGLEDSV